MMNIRSFIVIPLLALTYSCSDSDENNARSTKDASYILAERALLQLEIDYGIIDAQIIDVVQLAHTYDSKITPLIKTGENEFAVYYRSRIRSGFDTTYLLGNPPFNLEAYVIFIIKALDKDEVYSYAAYAYDNHSVIHKGKNYWTGLDLDSITYAEIFPYFDEMPRGLVEGLRYWRKEKRDILSESGRYFSIFDFYNFSWLDLKE